MTYIASRRRGWSDAVLSSTFTTGEVKEKLEWEADALCAQVGTEMFFPEKGGTTRDAKRICDDCPVRQDCLDYALTNDVRHGVWGGLSERERRALIRARRTAA